MNEESPIQFSENENNSTLPLPEHSSGVGENLAIDDRVRIAAKSAMMLFGLLLVVVLPVGALVSDRGILTSTPKPSSQEATTYSNSQSGTDLNQHSPINRAPIESDSQVTPPVATALPQSTPRKEDDDAVVMRGLVLSVSQSVRNFAGGCRQSGGVILSGTGGSRLCSVDTPNLIVWPIVSVCGPSPSDTKWTVFRGNTDTWDITITCARRPECDGPRNALCTKDGCTFSEICLPK